MTYPVELAGVNARLFSLPVSSTGTVSPIAPQIICSRSLSRYLLEQEALWQTICR